SIDGKVGAWTGDRKLFVTSPNSSVIYQPLLGTREVYLRQDYRLGAEDPLLYPQPFIPERCHLAAIPRRPGNPKHPLEKWWIQPPPQAFADEPDTTIKGLGRWTKDHYWPYEEDCCLLRNRVSKYRSSQESVKINSLITALDSHLEQTLSHIKGMPLPWHRAQQLWSFFQR
ncbi:hypothetical protein V5O48_019617, partial [Marasmius crinis-equi]